MLPAQLHTLNPPLPAALAEPIVQMRGVTLSEEAVYPRSPSMEGKPWSPNLNGGLSNTKDYQLFLFNDEFL